MSCNVGSAYILCSLSSVKYLILYVFNLFVLIASIKKMRKGGGDLPLKIQFSTK